MPNFKQIFISRTAIGITLALVTGGLIYLGIQYFDRVEVPEVVNYQDSSVLPDYERKIDEALLLRSRGQEDEAIVLLTQAIAEEPDTEAKGHMSAQLGKLYFDIADYEAALSAYRQAEEFGLGDNDFIVTGIIATAKALEDVELELEYQRRFVELLKPRSEIEAADTGEAIALLERAEERVEALNEAVGDDE